jgi:argininosuccinate synthase
MKDYDVTAARGFIDLFGLPMKVRGLKQKTQLKSTATAKR